MRIKEPFKQEVWKTGRDGLQEEEASDLGNEEIRSDQQKLPCQEMTRMTLLCEGEDAL